MAKLSISNTDLVVLSTELTHIVDTLNKADLQVPKFYVSTLNTVLSPLFKQYDESKIAIFKKYGTLVQEEGKEDKYTVQQWENLPKEGGVYVEGEDKGKELENYIEFNAELKKLNEIEVLVNYTAIPLSEWREVKDVNFYAQFYKFIDPTK
jgi:hypothetical protein